MYKPVIKIWFVVCFAVCGVFSHVVTLETTHNTQITFLEENSDPCVNNPCRNDGICTVNNEDYVCDCKKPYSGKHCEIHPCHSSPCLNEGACIGVENTYGCVCDEPFHGRHCENDPCSSSPCKHEGVCSVHGIDFNCSCKPPYFGKQCESIYETTVSGNDLTTTSYECDCGPNSTGCHLDNGLKVCHCKNGYAQGSDGMCQACDCGKKAYDCEYKNDGKKCYCSLYYAELDGTCIECKCEEGGICEFENGTKTCSCFPHQRYFQGKCKYCYCGNYANECGFFDDGKVNCDCQEGYVQRNDYCVDINSTINENMTTETYLSTRVSRDECNCGVNSVSCRLDWWGKKDCKCKDNYAPKNETCMETCQVDGDCYNGGYCRREGSGYFCQCIGTYIGDRCETDVCDSIRYWCESMRAECKRRGSTAVCECPDGTIRTRFSDMCEDSSVCDYRTCIYGVCQVTGNSSYICICDPGYYGRHCEFDSNIIFYTLPWGYLLILSILTVIFSIGSIIAAQWVKKLRKQIEDNAKEIRNA